MRKLALTLSTAAMLLLGAAAPALAAHGERGCDTATSKAAAEGAAPVAAACARGR